ncbi:MAG: hypothetical protein JWM32_3103 [Verrucomicrobia bacterium]|nr:hypothetical protein [Verrucomicrobiota bacterium]
MDLRLCDLIRLAHVELGNFKIHFAKHPKFPPLAAYLDGTFKEWQEYQTRKNFPCDHVVSLIALDAPRWLFAGVWKIEGAERKTDGTKSWWGYSTTEVTGLEHLAGRVIVRYGKLFRAPYLLGKKFGDQLTIAEILPEKMTLAEFPGFSSVLLSFAQLKRIVTQGTASWRGALKSVAGVYLLTDTLNGKHYVGSAYGIEGIWGRWAGYVASQHGGNVELKALVAEVGLERVTHFQFSILEICDVMEPKEKVLTRESHWKNALKSRGFGYNSN